MLEVAYFVCCYCTMMLGRILPCWTPVDILTVFPTHRIAPTRVSCSANQKNHIRGPEGAWRIALLLLSPVLGTSDCMYKK